MDSAYGTDDDSNIIMRNNEDLLEEEEDHEHDDQEEESQLPGFRFYPTDEELVDFYLRRKVENKPFTLDLIKDIDIYKHDPWDLPKSSTVGDNEWYFFCKRGRKYRNSVRPNRVTGSGFWKATGIDKPIRSNNNDIIVGLKKSLVYYIGNAGKGNKTDWMMHEFRLPAPQDFITHNSPPTVTLLNDMDTTQEASFQEVWTVCRIFQRNVPSRKYTSNWREISTKRSHSSTSTGSMGADVVLGSNSSSDQQVCSRTKNKSTIKGESFISFSNNIPASNDNPQQQAVALLQNPNYDYYSNTSSHHDRPPTTFPAGFVGHEHFGYSSNYYEPLPRTHTSTMDQETPVDQRPGSSSSFYPHESAVSPMDISSYQGNSSDQLVGTQESWDELRQFWSSFQDQ